ncbi:hypothetical protein GCM10011578_053730 [Streptomyces fuscichromogenes]|uniref:Uncharacterized protein n=1 Tax=Streptomyces fuscichromogenes TaxID=1324013 RepID=A0A917XFZ2_9ACTN|nr:hypothetical protein GCM10011578_053730 [Streptomyces fuscichromogenes]
MARYSDTQQAISLYIIVRLPSPSRRLRWQPRQARENAGVPSERALFVGDSVWDMKAAVRDGVTPAAVLSGGIPHVDLEEASTHAVYPDPADLLARLDTSVLADTERRPRPASLSWRLSSTTRVCITQVTAVFTTEAMTAVRYRSTGCPAGRRRSGRQVRSHGLVPA